MYTLYTAVAEELINYLDKVGWLDEVRWSMVQL